MLRQTWEDATFYIHILQIIFAPACAVQRQHNCLKLRTLGVIRRLLNAEHLSFRLRLTMSN